MIRPVSSLSTLATTPFARDVKAGLARPRKSIPSSYFYDARGSELFERITTLDEYYLTRCERAILQERGAEIAQQMPDRPYRLIELGAGDGHKTRVLLQHLLAAGQAITYLPIDICAPSVERLVREVERTCSSQQLRVQGMAADYFDALASLRLTRHEPSVVLFLGSSIGNMTAFEAQAFLTQVRLLLNPGDRMLIGFDLKKPLAVLQAAYDDRAGVTREFNFNLLDRINGELDGEFDRHHFTHYARYNFRRHCMESWLVSDRRQQVAIPRAGCIARFQAGEGMLLERSHKYDRRSIERLAQAAGFAVKQHFVDAQRYFVDSLWQVPEGPPARSR